MRSPLCSTRAALMASAFNPIIPVQSREGRLAVPLRTALEKRRLRRREFLNASTRAREDFQLHLRAGR